MKLSGSIFLCVTLLPTMALAQGKPTHRTIQISNLDKPMVVPKGKIWEIKGLKPYESENGIGTADLYINGQILIARDQAYTIHGKFDISINNTQPSSIWLLPGTSISVGDSREFVVIIESNQ